MGGALAIGVIAAMPSVVLASGNGFNAKPVSLSALGGIGSFTPASIDKNLVSSLKLSELRASSDFRFTPAAEDGVGKRAVTVAARVRDESAKAITIRNAIGPVGKGAAPIKITPTSYSLGVAKGWQRFALPESVKKLDVPDLAEMGTAPNRLERAEKPSRFSSRVDLDSKAQLGRAPRTFEGENAYSVDVGGSYRLSNNLDVTAGVRLRDERDRLSPLNSKQMDSQAVYVGTQFRF
ncbi:hypothetical protein [Alterisphingorhabdus coralli]|uniref:Uncharacterized protein n=1 Tax=Alterisphingorhabdus coralli TaxID=3071408 RepID=A0AA97I197_9SPHN|nr:hypothetical protein [Parasphingorhabdus sp. SCSIO 66989]WOE75060.1 hypothetical protein RB602_14700 [Parasphingorhabdus sp. SCSIO 66989]